MERSSKSLRRFLEVSANLGIVIVALIIVGNFVASKWRTKRDVDTIKTGSQVSLSGVKWEAGSTLVLALQRGCRYCDESAPFYRRPRWSPEKRPCVVTSKPAIEVRPGRVVFTPSLRVCPSLFPTQTVASSDLVRQLRGPNFKTWP